MSENMRMPCCSNSEFAAVTNSHIYISHMPEDTTFMEILQTLTEVLPCLLEELGLPLHCSGYDTRWQGGIYSTVVWEEGERVGSRVSRAVEYGCSYRACEATQ